ncbi:MAG: osmoregulated proline transporter OpuE [Candidatus Neomarinimicrobiota bacterium]|nr:MAG: osmoregulated proline transporter OpuE [Candidatus Neomarinimicrobiota bacterium]
MDQTLTIIATLILYKIFLVYIGWSTRKKNITIEDYFVGGKKLGPVITSISYAASNSSAWTLLGVSGIAFSQGVSTIWLVIGVVGGMFLSWHKVGPSILEITRQKNLITVPQLIVSDLEMNKRKTVLVTSSFIIIFSFSFYIASQFQGAGNALSDTFGLGLVESVIISAVVIYIYTYLGGYLAVSITDTIQGLLMALTATVMPVMAIYNLGGVHEFYLLFAGSASHFKSLSAGNIGFAILGLVVGHLGIGLGYFGQPHLLSRFISVKDQETLVRSKKYALVWFCLVFFGMWTLGIAGHFMIDDLANNENIFFKISGEIFHPIAQGILLAAVISAIMSTADSQILVCSSSISLDLGLKQSSLRISRLITGGVIFASVLIALLIPEKIFSRVLFAWTAMGSSFGPAVIARISNWKLSENHILLSMVIGFVLAIVFFLLPDSTGDWIERVIPFFAGLICLFILKK